MIDVQELRIGNYVTTIRNDEMQQVDCIKQEQVKDGFYSSVRTNKCSDYFLPEHIFPITITKAVLLKCGFSYEKCDGNDWMRMHYNDFVFDTDESIEFSAVELNHKGYSMFNCEFLHELQNAYFLVTKQELNIQL